MSDEHESSYYEIALTNRQVVVFFVALLGFLLVVFLSGVWVGRGSEPTPRPAALQADVDLPTSAEELDHIDELQAFGDAPLDKPDLGRLLEEPSRDTTLAEDLGTPPPPSDPPARPRPVAVPAAGSPAAGSPAGASSGSPAAGTPAAGTPAAQPSPPPAAAPRRDASSAAPPTDGLVIQVFSSRDEAQARRVLGQMRADGHRAYLDSVDVGSTAMHRVRIGPFAARPQAERTADQVKRKFRLETWITSAAN
ncbi:MAG: SPOR domain-containing protein [Acidobacteriota bacterium]